jgi:hypothetical protein
MFYLFYYIQKHHSIVEICSSYAETTTRYCCYTLHNQFDKNTFTTIEITTIIISFIFTVEYLLNKMNANNYSEI